MQTAQLSCDFSYASTLSNILKKKYYFRGAYSLIYIHISQANEGFIAMLRMKNCSQQSHRVQI